MSAAKFKPSELGITDSEAPNVPTCPKCNHRVANRWFLKHMAECMVDEPTINDEDEIDTPTIKVDPMTIKPITNPVIKISEVPGPAKALLKPTNNVAPNVPTPVARREDAVKSGSTPVADTSAPLTSGNGKATIIKASNDDYLIEIEAIQSIIQEVIDGKLYLRDIEVYSVRNCQGIIRHVQFNTLNYPDATMKEIDDHK